MIKFGFIFSLCFIVLVSLSSCTPHKQKISAPQVLAFVNGVSILENQLKHRLYLEKAKFDDEALQDKDLLDSLKTEILNQMVRNKAIVEWGRKRNITLTSQELAEGLEAIKKGYTDKAFESFLSERGIPFSEWRLMAEEKILSKKIIDTQVYDPINVTAKEVGQYYEQNKNNFKKGESVRARHIVTDTREKAEKILQLLAGGESFTKAAIMHSVSPDRSNGGDLGYFTKGTYPKEFDETCFKLEPGKLSHIIKSPYGYHLFRIIDKKPAHTSTLEEVYPQIYSLLAKNKMTTAYEVWLDSVLKESQIQIIEENLKQMRL
jgi:peptidyl-prolyl cis-trans isomerase C